MEKSVFVAEAFTISTGVGDGSVLDSWPWSTIGSLTGSPRTPPDANYVLITEYSVFRTYHGPKQKFTKINAPSAGTAAGEGTFGYGISNPGAIIGWYVDANNANHGFVATPNGAVTKFNAPGAGTGAGQGTTAFAINPAGTIVGLVVDSGNVQHGFIRAPDGKTTTFNAPGAGTGAGQGTALADVTSSGEIAGNFSDANNAFHSFLIAPDGEITMVNVPGAGTGAGEGTFVPTMYGLNPLGALTGNYVDANNVSHGYVRAPNGKITTFNAPGAGTAAGEGTTAYAINPRGAITGYFADANMADHGFVRAPDGKITTFDAPGAGTAAGEGTVGASISPNGLVAGYDVDGSDVAHGFLRAPDGQIVTFNAPGAGTTAGEGTFCAGAHAAGAVAGYYVDANNVAHAFSATIQFMGPDPTTVGSFVAGTTLAPPASGATTLCDFVASQASNIGMSDLVPGSAAVAGPTAQGESSLGLPDTPIVAGFGGLAFAGSADGYGLVINVPN